MSKYPRLLLVGGTFDEQGGKVSSVVEKVRKDMELENKVKGVVVSNVMEKSPAAALRLQNGDVITAVNGKSVTDLKSFYTELATADKAVNFDIYSNGGTITTGTYKF